MRTLRDGHRRRGSYGGMLILTLPTIVGAGTISVDLSSQKIARTQLQAVSDIAAMAGTDLLDGTTAGLVAAQDTAARAAARNSVGGAPVVIPDAQMLLGAWDSTSQTLSTTAATADINSIQVQASRDNLDTSFAKIILNQRTMGASGRSTGFNPPDDAASAVRCYLPIAIPACLFDLYTTDELSDITLVLNPAGIDNAGWGRIGGHPNASWIRDQLEDCEQDGIATVGDEVGLQNGVVNSALDEIHDQIVDSETEWDDDEWGEEPDPMCHSSLAEDDDDDGGEDCDDEDDGDHESEDEADDDGSSHASGHSDDDHGHSASRSSEDDDGSYSEDDEDSAHDDEGDDAHDDEGDDAHDDERARRRARL
ncbi:MAG: hypothetical protein GXP62_06980 [Oligoflexia bacterium]|nr:hypothetical protein [Oligoflexia bacterium]